MDSYEKLLRNAALNQLDLADQALAAQLVHDITTKVENTCKRLNITVEVYRQIEKLLYQQRWFSAVKAYREATGASLKDALETIEDRNNWTR